MNAETNKTNENMKTQESSLAKWSLTKTEHRDGTSEWNLWDSTRDVGHTGARARGIAQALEKRGIRVQRETRFDYPRSAVGLYV